MKQVQGINTGSMADIAFLLLVFFFVTTNINQDFAINSNISKPFEVPDSLSIHQSTLGCIAIYLPENQREKLIYVGHLVYFYFVFFRFYIQLVRYHEVFEP